MPQVPYKPVPDVKATDSGPGGVSVSTPIAAFGGDVATAIGSLGKQVDHAADEIWKRGLAMQAVVNEADARAATTDYMETAGQLHAEFNSRQGRDAVTAYPKYIQDLKETRKTLGQRLGNDAARKMYDAQSMPTMSRSIFNGAGHAATENKRYAAGTAQAKLDATNNYVLQNPDDDNAVRQGITENANIIRNIIAPLKGFGPEQTEEAINKGRSTLLASRIIGMARTKPYRAQELFEAHREDLYGPDIDKVERVVKNQLDTTGARILTERITAPLRDFESDKPQPTLEQMLAEGEREANRVDPNNEMFKERVRQGIIGKYNQVKQIKLNTERANVETVVGGIIGQASPDGRKPVSVEELTSLNPKIEMAWEGLSNPKKKQMLVALANNAKGDYAETPESRAKYRELLGMRATEPEKFIDYDILSEKMPEAQKTELYKLQLKTRVKVDDDPRVTRAMNTMHPILEALKSPITFKDDPERYNKFRGGMQLLIEDWVRTHGGKQPTTEEMRIMGNGLLQETEIDKGWLWNSKKTLFERPITDEEFEKAIADPRFERSGLPPPTKEEVRQELIRRRFQELYGGRPKAKDPTRVPGG